MKSALNIKMNANVVPFKSKASIQAKAATQADENDYFVRYAALHRSIIADLIVTVSEKRNVGLEYITRVVEAKFNATCITDMEPKQLFDAIAFLLELRGEDGQALNLRVVAGRA
jgi:hypothetical protein